MTIANGYATSTECKARLGITDATDDTIIESVIEAVSRWIDHYCRRTFYASASTEARYYTPIDSMSVRTDDIVSITSIATDDTATRAWGTTWATTDYETAPVNYTPITALYVTPNGRYRFTPTITKSVKIVGTFGYASTAPAPVKEACLIQACRVFKRKDSPFGIAGAGALGQTMMIGDLDPDVKALLAPPVRRLFN